MTSIPNPTSNDPSKLHESKLDESRTDRASTVGPPLPQEVASQHSGFQIWMHRLSVLLFVLISAVAGVLLLILPWTPNWTDNYLLLSYPDLRPLVSSGFFRGICSGLGLLDIWIGFWEALHYHEQQ